MKNIEIFFINTTLNTTNVTTLYLQYAHLQINVVVRMSYTQINENEIASMLVDSGKGDCQAFDLLYKNVSVLLKRFALGIVHNEALANEILQDSLIQVWLNASSFDPARGKPLTWLRTIVRNKSIDKLRCENKHTQNRHIENDDMVDELPSAKSYEPEECLSKTQLSEYVNTQFESLPSNQRLSILLAYFYEYSRQELAVSIDTNLNTIKSWLRRGINTMKNNQANAQKEGKQHTLSCLEYY